MKRAFLLFLAFSALAGVLPAQEEDGKNGEHTIYLRDFGGHDTAFLKLPEEAPAAGLVLLPGRGGVDATVKDICRKLARKQLITLAVDVYAGRPAKTEEEWAFLQASLDSREMTASVASGCRFFRESPRFHVERLILLGTGRQAEALLGVAPEDKAVAGVVLLDPEFPPDFKWPDKPMPPLLMVRTVKKGEPEAVWAAISGAREFQTVEVSQPLLADSSEKAWLPVTVFIEGCRRPETRGWPLWKKLFGE